MSTSPDKPLVSILIPVYNGSEYMQEAIDSALSQTYTNIEILVINDGSNDEGKTEKIALSYGNAIRYYEKTNGGVSSALNLGISKMRGTYFSWLSHDDKYLPGKIKAQIDALEEDYKEDIVVLCASKHIDKYSKDLPFHKQNVLRKTILSWQEALKELIMQGSYNGCALLIPKSIFSNIGIFNEKLRFSQDFLMWIKIFMSGYKLIKIPEVYVCNRIHSNQLTQKGKQIFLHDTCLIGDMLMNDLVNISTVDYPFMKYFTLYAAKYGVYSIVKKYIAYGLKHKKFTIIDVLQVLMIACYGRIRPFVRKVYYLYRLKVRTQ